MIDERSRHAVADARDGAGRTRPLYGSYCFDGLPGTVEHVLGGRSERRLPASVLPGTERVRRVVLAYLDALPAWLCARLSAEPALERLGDGVVSTLTSMFPSTTTGHVAAIHTGLRSAESGLYEWLQYEPSVDEIVLPLTYERAVARDGVRRADFAPDALLPPGLRTIYERLGELGVRSTVHQRHAFARSPLTRYATAGATLVGHDGPAEAARNVLRSLETAAGPHYAFLYLETIDAAGHRSGPESPEYEAEARRVLGALERDLLAPLGRRGAGETLVLVTTDHGMAETPADRITYANRAWPEVERHIRRDGRGNPLVAGSCRDLFLHVAPEAVDLVVAGLATALPVGTLVLPVERALADGLFGDAVSARFRERVGNVLVLAPAGSGIWWDEPPGYRYALLGQHGGLSAEEMEIPLYALVL
jgi:Type I phosphodiesterase / nucleotide pyrophosphatase